MLPASGAGPHPSHPGCPRRPPLEQEQLDRRREAPAVPRAEATLGRQAGAHPQEETRDDLGPAPPELHRLQAARGSCPNLFLGACDEKAASPHRVGGPALEPCPNVGRGLAPQDEPGDWTWSGQAQGKATSARLGLVLSPGLKCSGNKPRPRGELAGLSAGGKSWPRPNLTRPGLFPSPGRAPWPGLSPQPWPVPQPCPVPPTSVPVSLGGPAQVWYTHPPSALPPPPALGSTCCLASVPQPLCQEACPLQAHAVTN